MKLVIVTASLLFASAAIAAGLNGLFNDLIKKPPTQPQPKPTPPAPPAPPVKK